MSLPQATRMAPSTLLATLRDATRNEHASLERHPLLHSLVSDQLVLQDYLGFLAALLAFYRQLEPQLERKLPVDCQRQAVCCVLMRRAIVLFRSARTLSPCWDCRWIRSWVLSCLTYWRSNPREWKVDPAFRE